MIMKPALGYMFPIPCEPHGFQYNLSAICARYSSSVAQKVDTMYVSYVRLSTAQPSSSSF